MASLRREPAYRPRIHAGPDLGDDAGGHIHRFADGPHIFVRIYERGTRVPEILCLPVTVHDEHARPRSGYQHLPDVYFLGTRGSQLISPDRILLHEKRGHRGFQESLHRHPLRGSGLPHRHSHLRILYRIILIYTGFGRNGYGQDNAAACPRADVYRRRRKECDVPSAYLAS